MYPQNLRSRSATRIIVMLLALSTLLLQMQAGPFPSYGEEEKSEGAGRQLVAMNHEMNYAGLPFVFVVGGEAFLIDNGDAVPAKHYGKEAVVYPAYPGLSDIRVTVTIPSPETEIDYFDPFEAESGRIEDALYYWPWKSVDYFWVKTDGPEDIKNMQFIHGDEAYRAFENDNGNTAESYPTTPTGYGLVWLDEYINAGMTVIFTSDEGFGLPYGYVSKATGIQSKGFYAFTNQNFRNTDFVSYRDSDVQLGTYVSIPGTHDVYINGSGDPVGISVDGTSEYTTDTIVTIDNGDVVKLKKPVLELDNTPPVVSYAAFDPEYGTTAVSGTARLEASDTKSGLKSYTFAVKNATTGKLVSDPLTVDADKEDYEISLSVEAAQKAGEIAATDELAAVMTAMDRLGNETAERVFSEVYADPDAPEISIAPDDYKAPAGKAGVTVKATVSDNGSGLNTINATLNGAKIDADIAYPKKNSFEWAVNEEFIKRTCGVSEKGEYVLYMEACDNAGNENKGQATLYIDIEDPVLTFENFPSGIVAGLDDMKVTADQADTSIKVIIKNDGALFFGDTGTGSYGLPSSVFSKDGAYSVEIEAFDAAGNTASEEKGFTLDTAAPEIIGIDYAGDWITALPLSITPEIAEANAYTAACTVDGEAVPLQEGKLIIDEALAGRLGSGEFAVSITATDEAGHQSAPYSFVAKLDVPDPVITVSGIGDGAFYQAFPPFFAVGAETDNIVRIEVRVGDKTQIINGDALAWGGFSDEMKSLLGKDGDFSMAVKGISLSGKETDTFDARFIIDAALPVISGVKVSAAENGNGWHNKPLDISYTVEDRPAGIKNVEVTLNGKALSSYTEAAKIYERHYIENITAARISGFSTGNGQYTVEITAYDRKGNKSSLTVPLKIDITAPVLSLSGIDESGYYGSAPTLQAALDEANYSQQGSYMTLSVTRDGEAAEYRYDRSNSLTTRAFVEDGNYTVKASAEDAAGNKAAPVSVGFVLDTKAPVISMSGAGGGEFYRTSKNLSTVISERNFGTASAGMDIVYADAAGNVIDTESLKIPLGGIDSALNKGFDGTYTVSVSAWAYDKAGNTSETKKATFTVDREPPAIAWAGVFEGIAGFGDAVFGTVGVSDAYLKGKSLTLATTGGAKDIVTETDDGGYVIKSPGKSKANDGAYTLTAEATDKAGNAIKQTKTLFICRFGSAMYWDEASWGLNGGYYKKLPGDVVLTEVSVLGVTGVPSAIISRDGESVTEAKIVPDRVSDNTVNHKIGAETFSKEGFYKIDIISKDPAGNTNTASEKAGALTFAVDKTPPVVVITGLSSGDAVNKDDAIFAVQVSDNIAADGDALAVTIDGKAVKPTGEERGEAGEPAIYKYNTGSGENMKIAVKASDKAGNEKTVTLKNITVGKGFAAKGSAATPVAVAKPPSILPVAIAGILFAMAAGIIAFAICRKKKGVPAPPVDEEEDTVGYDGTASAIIGEAGAGQTPAPSTGALSEGSTEFMQDGASTRFMGNGASIEFIQEGAGTEFIGEGSGTEVMQDGPGTEVMPGLNDTPGPKEA